MGGSGMVKEKWSVGEGGWKKRGKVRGGALKENEAIDKDSITFLLSTSQADIQKLVSLHETPPSH